MLKEHQMPHNITVLEKKVNRANINYKGIYTSAGGSVIEFNVKYNIAKGKAVFNPRLPGLIEYIIMDGLGISK
jgi:hypothetical protein